MLENIRENCPYCGELIELLIDCSQGDHSYIEDCFVCCRPITVEVQTDQEKLTSLVLRAEND